MTGRSIGFTGTRSGLTPQQRSTLREILRQYRLGYFRAEEAHHGLCVGGDESFAQIAHEIGYRVIGHPPTDPRYVSEDAVSFCDEMRMRRDYLLRNHDIVDESDILIVGPKQLVEPSGAQAGGGTWATVRYARRMEEVSLVFLNLNGTTRSENWPIIRVR